MTRKTHVSLPAVSEPAAAERPYVYVTRMARRTVIEMVAFWLIPESDSRALHAHGGSHDTSALPISRCQLSKTPSCSSARPFRPVRSLSPVAVLALPLEFAVSRCRRPIATHRELRADEHKLKETADQLVSEQARGGCLLCDSICQP